MATSGTSGWSRAGLGTLLRETFLSKDLTRLAVSKNTKFFKSMKISHEKILQGDTFELAGFPNTIVGMRGMNGEWGDTAKPYDNTGQRLKFSMKWFNQTARISGQAIRNAAIIGDARAMQLAVEELMISNALHSEIGMFIPSTGVLANIVSAASATQIVVDDHRFLGPQTRIGILNSTTGNEDDGRASIVISGRVPESPLPGQATLTLESPGLVNFAAVGTTYSVYWDGGFNVQHLGLPDIISDANPAGGFYGLVDRTLGVNENYRAKTLDAGGNQPVGDMFADMFDTLSIETDMDVDSGVSEYVLMLNHRTRTSLMQALKASSLADFPRLKFEIWGETITFRGVPIIGHRYMSATDAWFIHMPSLTCVVPEGMQRMGEWAEYLINENVAPEEVWNRIDGKYGYESLFIKANQLVTAVPNRFGHIRNIQRRIVNL